MARSSTKEPAGHDEVPGPAPAPARRGLATVDLNEIVSYHAPNEAQTASDGHIREAAKPFAAVVLTHTPPCADPPVAIRKIREAVMGANASIALGGQV